MEFFNVVAAVIADNVAGVILLLLSYSAMTSVLAHLYKHYYYDND